MQQMETPATELHPEHCFCRQSIDIRGASGLDEIDRHIVDLLLSDCRLSNVEIARMIGSTETTVRRRISNLQMAGTIRNFSALLELRKFGNYVKVIVNAKVRKRDMKKLASRMVALQNVVSVYRTIGEDDMSIEVLFRDLTEFQSFMDSMQGMEEVRSTEYLIVSESFRYCPWCGI